MNVQDLSPETVMSVYSGTAGKCCCGCAGTHSYVAAHRVTASEQRGYEVTDDEINNAQVTRVIRIIQENEKIAEPGSNHVAVVVGKRIYIAYYL